MSGNHQKKTSSKSQSIVQLLRRRNGATLDELATATGWQAHSVRAALSRLRKSGSTLVRTRTSGVSRYRLQAKEGAR